MSEVLAAFSNSPDQVASQPKFYIDSDRVAKLKDIASIRPFTFLSMRQAVIRMYPQELQVPEVLRPERKVAEKRVRDIKFLQQ